MLLLKRTSYAGRARFTLDGLRGCAQTETDVDQRLKRVPGLTRVAASHHSGTILIEYDPRRWTTDTLQAACERALRGVQKSRPAQPTAPLVRSSVEGRLRVVVPGLFRVPEREAIVEATFRAVPGVLQTQANARTGRLLVVFDPDLCTVENLLEVARSWPRSPLSSAPSPTHTSDRGASGRPALNVAPTTMPWHARNAAEILAELEVRPETGLTAAQVEARRRHCGANRLPAPTQPSFGRLFFSQLLNAPTALLGAGAAISLLTGGLFETALIVTVLGANAVAGAATERTGNRAIATLRHSATIRARITRDGIDEIVSADDLVPGDVLDLISGDPVPADARIISSASLRVEESTLTGESRPAHKRPEPDPARATLGDRHAMVFRGTTVVGGRGRAVVVATGAGTAFGALHRLAASAEAPPTPLERDLHRLGRWLAIGAGSICLGVLGIGLLRGGAPLAWLEVAVSLGVAAVPEGLTALATSVLALASGRMRRRGTLIRTLNAAEALGSVTVVCADKTGTLTENRMAARELYLPSGRVQVSGPALRSDGIFTPDEGSVVDLWTLRRALRVGVLCSDAEIEQDGAGGITIDGSSTEGALQVAALKAGLNPGATRAHYPRLDVRDRSDGRRHMLTVHRIDGRLVACLKGSPEEVLALCTQAAHAAGDAALLPAEREVAEAANASMAARGRRVLALAERVLPEAYTDRDLGQGYTFLGLIGLTDPIRPGVPAAIEALRGAGIRTIMITGDQAGTAIAVARELGLVGEHGVSVLEGSDLVSLSPDALRAAVRDLTVFARVEPDMKLAVVRALQADGEVVGMTGDGVNDGPALRAADVGVAMGEHGTELARELADVVLSTDDFSLMADAVEEGRLVRANIRRVLHYLLSTNASEVWVVAGAVASGLPVPLTPLQLLWLNLVTDLAPGLGLAVEPRDPDLMRQPPRDPREPIIPPRLQRRVLGESGAIALGALATYGIGLVRHGQGPIAQTMAFASLVGAQLLHVPLARAGSAPATRGARPRNRALSLGVGMSVGLQAIALFVPSVRGVLGGAALGLADLGIAALGAALPIAAIETNRRLADAKLP